MSAAGKWNAEPRESVAPPGPPVPRPAAGAEKVRAPLDLDAWQAVGWALVGSSLYLLGVLVAGFGLAATFGWWVGGLLVLLAGGVPAGYSLVKAHQRTAVRDRAVAEARFRGDQPAGSGGAPPRTYPIPTRD